MAVRRLTRVLQDIRRAALHDAVSLDDGQLLDHFIEHKDEAAFAALVQRHSAMVWGVCRRVLAHHHDAEDAFQATFLVLARKAASVRPRALVANWLYGVAHRTALKAKTIAGKRRMREKQVFTMPEPAVVRQDSWPNLELLIDQELANLPDKYRVVLLLCDLEGKTGREVARQLQIPEGTLAGRLRTGRVLLAKRLTRHGLGLSGGALATVLSQNAASAGAPPAVVSTTIKTATLVAAGKTVAAGMIPAKVAALTEGVLTAMLLTKLKTLIVPLLALGMFTFGGGLLIHDEANGRQSKGAQTPERVCDQAKTEAHLPVKKNAPDGDIDGYLKAAFGEKTEALQLPIKLTFLDGDQRVVFAARTFEIQVDGRLKLQPAYYARFPKAGRPTNVFQGDSALLTVDRPVQQLSDLAKRSLVALEFHAKQTVGIIVPEDTNAKQTRFLTNNFDIKAPTAASARKIGARAEAERKRLAIQWLGQEAPAWKKPCPVRVKIGPGKANGYAMFGFDETRRFAPEQEIVLEGPLTGIVEDALPQQVAHSLLAHELGLPHPRWVEAGAGIMAQSATAKNQRLALLPKAIAAGKAMLLTKLLESREYPDPSVLETWYAQSYSLCQYLVDRKDHATFLAFVQRGMQRGWGDALKRYYGFDDVAELDAAWRKSVKDMKVKKVGEVLKSLEMYYIIVRELGTEEHVYRLPFTGMETVLDAITERMNYKAKLGRMDAWIIRLGLKGEPQKLPIDLVGITERGLTQTNYQLQSGDRLFLVEQDDKNKAKVP